MPSLVARRLLTVVPTLLLTTFFIVNIVNLVPGDAAIAIAGEHASDERLAQIRSDLGLERSVFAQYADWLAGAVRGDFGVSLQTGESVTDIVLRRLPATLHVVLAAAAFAIIVGTTLGVAAALRHRTRTDRVVTSLSTAGVAIPNFWLAMILVIVFSINLGWLPATGYTGVTEDFGQSLKSLVLPAVALGSFGAAEVARQSRSAMIEVLSSDFIRTHRAKGLKQSRIIGWHALRNAGPPLITVFGLLISRLVSATVVIEVVFAIPGSGSLAAAAVTSRDYPVLQGLVFALVLIVVLTNLFVDVAYRLIDPRVRT